MSDSLRLVLADARFPSGDPSHSGGVEAACAAGLVTGMESLRGFLYGRLWTTGSAAAVAAAAVCARAGNPAGAPALFRTVEAELDARIASPAARGASRRQGGQILRRAASITCSEVLDAVGRAALAHERCPHQATAIGAVAAVAGASPEEAAEAAAFASVSQAALAAERLLGLDPAHIAALSAELAPEVGRLAAEAAQACMHPLSQIPAFAAPALEYLAEAHLGQPQRSFAS